MSKKENKTLVPTLRFPEFRKAEGWKKRPLGPYVEQYSEKVPSSTKLEIYSSTREGLKPQNEYYDGRNLVNEGEYGVVPVEYFVYRHMSDDDVFKFNLNQLGKKIAVSKEYPVFRTVNLDARFLLYKLNEGREFKRFAVSQKKGGTRTRLYFNTLRTFAPFVPALEEQKKIADCITSVDELIITQVQKLAALKAYKKGLMYQVFPAEGETVPKCRFPEFRERDEWQITRIEQACEKPFSGGTPSTANKEYYGGTIPFIRSAEIDQETTELFLTDEGLDNSSAKLVKEGDVLVALYGANSGEVALAKIDGAINQAILCLRSKSSNAFLYQILLHKKQEIISKYLQGGQGNLSGDIIKSIELLFPEPEEQEKIADFLSTVDDLITVQTQKIEALKDHKRGLMQQLFPITDDVNE